MYQLVKLTQKNYPLLVEMMDEWTKKEKKHSSCDYKK